MRVSAHLSVKSLTEFLSDKDRADATARFRAANVAAPVSALPYQDAIRQDILAAQAASFAEPYPCTYQQEKEYVVDLPSVADAFVEAVTELSCAMENFGNLSALRDFHCRYGARRTAHPDIAAWMGFKMIQIDGVLYDALKGAENFVNSAAGEAGGYKVIPKGAEVVFRQTADGAIPERRFHIILDVPVIIFDSVILKGLRAVATFTASGEPIIGYVRDEWTK